MWPKIKIYIVKTKKIRTQLKFQFHKMKTIEIIILLIMLYNKWSFMTSSRKLIMMF